MSHTLDESKILTTVQIFDQRIKFTAESADLDCGGHESAQEIVDSFHYVVEWYAKHHGVTPTERTKKGSKKGKK